MYKNKYLKHNNEINIKIYLTGDDYNIIISINIYQHFDRICIGNIVHNRKQGVLLVIGWTTARLLGCQPATKTILKAILYDVRELA